jgi:cytochrome c oxidase cbb3-type subunit III
VKRIRMTQERLLRSVTALGSLCWLLLVAVSGCDFPGKPALADRPIAADEVVNFDVLYRQNCSGCHGANGKFGPAPPLNDPVFLSIVPDSVLLSVISEGRSGTPMPAFTTKRGGPLNDAQVKALATGIKPRWGSTQTMQTAAPPYSIAADSAAGNKDRGERIFARACAPCHGPLGEGTKEGTSGAGAINDPSFLALISDQALRRYAITGRPDLGMPDHADKTGRSDDYRPMTSAEINDLVALLAAWRQENRFTSSMGP